MWGCFDSNNECALGWPVGKTGKIKLFWKVPVIYLFQGRLQTMTKHDEQQNNDTLQ